jgi:two-component system NtrC family sensor kinase
MKLRFLILFLLTLNESLIAQSFVISDTKNVVSITKEIKYFIDSNNSFQINHFKDTNLFNSTTGSTPTFTYDVKNVWIKFSVINKSSSNIYLGIPYPNISKVTLYKSDSGKAKIIAAAGNSVLKKQYMPGSPDIVFALDSQKNIETEYYVHIESIHPIILTMYLSTITPLLSKSSLKNFFVGFYFGLLVVIFLYNLFLFISTRDINYLLYILYIISLLFAQLAASGYGYLYIWPSKPEWNIWMVIITSSFSGITAFIFSISFLRIRYYTKKLYRYLLLIFPFYILAIIACLFKQYSLSYNILNYNSLFNGLAALFLSIYITKKGFRPAAFYLIAWSAFLISIVILVLRNINVLPYNNFTSSALYFGSALEVTLLSIALADRINILKKEKEQSQAEALQQAKENEQLVSEQNIILEKKVALRTSELQNTNVQLNDALTNLKDTQMQLVEAEKMASLGQLTAGIAHEINNPINFVKSNINPLRLDVKDLMEVLNAYDELHELNDHNTFKQKLTAIEELKEDMDVPFIRQEIDSLIIGIEEGAERTAEIVRGLRTFSRIDEAALKTVNLHDGILSTLVLLKNNIPYNIKVIKEFKANGEVECFPGKVNQVFMNIITNAIQAIKGKTEKTDEESITITTRDTEDEQIEISVKDTGPGMTEEVKHRIFEPFFTTKDVGEGTGLGMAIVFKIIQKHAGKINIITAPNEGAEFIITLPHKYQGTD